MATKVQPKHAPFADPANKQHSDEMLCTRCGKPGQTGRVRGILRRQCNIALGKLGDSVEGLTRALRYVQA